MNQTSLAEQTLTAGDSTGAPRAAGKALSPSAPPGAGCAVRLQLLGALSLIAGLGLVLAPRLAPSTSAWTERAGGATSVTALAVLGMFLWVSGSQRRAQNRLWELTASLRGDLQVFQDLGAELADVRILIQAAKSGNEGLRARMDEGLQRLEAGQETLRAEAAQRDPHDAVFKLASSVDRLGARFEERFLGNQEALERSAHEWRAALDDLRDAFDTIESLIRGGRERSGHAAVQETPFEMLDRLDDEVQRDSVAASLQVLAGDAAGALESSWLREHAEEHGAPPAHEDT
jgi:predicted NBD/HSP70 family sugar kinase